MPCEIVPPWRQTFKVPGRGRYTRLDRATESISRESLINVQGYLPKEVAASNNARASDSAVQHLQSARGLRFLLLCIFSS